MQFCSSVLRAGVVACLVAICCLPGVADTAPAKASTTEKPAEAYPPPDSTTQHSITLDGQKIDYTAVAGTITVGATDAEDAQLGLDGKPLPGSQLAITEPKEAKNDPPVAHMFYVYYSKNGARGNGAQTADRPIVFFYNGGPGSATVWLHMGSLGPMRVETPGDTHLPAAPYKLVDNPNCLLGTADLVFIDAPGTGFSQIVGKDGDKAFWGVDGDASAFGRFIQRFLSKYNRWNSPKYLFGESYGTTRSAVLANDLENNYSIDLNGVILLSQIFNFTSNIDQPQQNPGVDLPYELSLPTYAATAWYHKKLNPQPADLQSFLKQVEAYAMGPYRDALQEGTNLPQAQEEQVAEKLHEFTGLPVDYLMRADLRVNGLEFEKTLLQGSDETTGRLDTRFSGPTIDPLSEDAQYDPQSSAISSAYVALFNQYVREDLKYGRNQTYLPVSNTANTQWKMEDNGITGELNVSNDLATAMKTDPRLKVMVNGGYFDLATPFYAAEYEDEHLPISDQLAKNIEYNWYESGHMVYVRAECDKELHDRVAAFIESSDQ